MSSQQPEITIKAEEMAADPPPSATSGGEEASEAETLKRMGDMASDAIETIRKSKTIAELDIIYSIRIATLTKYIEEQTETNPNFTMEWVKKIFVTVDHVEVIRKACLMFVQKAVDYIEEMNQGPKELCPHPALFGGMGYHKILRVLKAFIPMDRANCLYRMKSIIPGGQGRQDRRVGLSWYCAYESPHTLYSLGVETNESGGTINKRYYRALAYIEAFLMMNNRQPGANFEYSDTISYIKNYMAPENRRY